MEKWVEYDPKRGIKETTWSDDADDKLIVRKEEDVQPLLDRNLELRNSRATDIGIKKGLWFYARIPITVQYELLKAGINMFRPEDDAKLFQALETDYKYLKTTDKKHLLRSEIGKRNSQEPTNSSSEENSTPRGPLLIVR